MIETLVVFNADGEIAMIVHDAANKDDPAWNPKGHATIEMKRADYDKCPHQIEVARSCLADLQKVSPVIAQSVDAIVSQADEVKAAQQELMDQAAIADDAVAADAVKAP